MVIEICYTGAAALLGETGAPDAVDYIFVNIGDSAGCYVDFSVVLVDGDVGACSIGGYELIDCCIADWAAGVSTGSGVYAGYSAVSSY